MDDPYTARDGSTHHEVNDGSSLKLEQVYAVWAEVEEDRDTGEDIDDEANNHIEH